MGFRQQHQPDSDKPFVAGGSTDGQGCQGAPQKACTTVMLVEAMHPRVIHWCLCGKFLLVGYKALLQKREPDADDQQNPNPHLPQMLAPKKIEVSQLSVLSGHHWAAG